MREMGGYIELDRYRGSMLHGNGLKLNSGRGALDYLIKAKGIKKLRMPKFMCDACDKVLKKNNVAVKYYSIGKDFKPTDQIERDRADDEWIFLVNFYGQVSEDTVRSMGRKVICDNAQAYFDEPIAGVDTLYTCRKYFGVPDGAILYTNAQLDDVLPQDESFERMRFLLGRFERTASEFYQEYVDNNRFFADEPVKRMSKLTENLLCGIDYELVKERRTENFRYLHERLAEKNKLSLTVPAGAFMYPFYIENGEKVRKALQSEKIYIPILWPTVFKVCEESELEYDMAQNILPLPIDQRYGIEDMEYLVSKIWKELTFCNGG